METYANAPNLNSTPKITIFEQFEIANKNINNPAYKVDTTSIEEQLRIANEIRNLSPLDLQNYNNYYREVYSDKVEKKTFSEADKKALLNYYKADLLVTGDLTNYHEENYLYTDGQLEKNIYNGIIGYHIGDFDNDTKLELAIFKIRTDPITENSIKEIYVDVVKLYNSLPYMFDRMILMREEFNAETIECDISYKEYNDVKRFYINYFDKKVVDNTIHNKFIAFDVTDKIHVVGDTTYSAIDDEYYHYDDNYNFTNVVIDAGIYVKDDDDIISHAFVNNDSKVHPITTLYRVNESLRDGYIENYLENYYNDFLKFGFLKIRYGYTNIMMR